MAGIFKNLRKYLASQSMGSKYLAYALGEILLIVIGILIALYLNNQSEARKQESNFKLSLQQLYNSINTESEFLNSYDHSVRVQISIIDTLLRDPTAFPDEKIIQILYYLDTYPIISKDETKYFLSNLKLDPDNPDQIELGKRISTYAENKIWDFNINDVKDIISPVLADNDIPEIFCIFGFDAINDFAHVDTTFYDNQDINKVRSLIGTRKFKGILKSIQSTKQGFLITTVENVVEDINSVMEKIESYHPDVKLLYDDIGIIGDALGTGWHESVPMTLVDDKRSIWTLDIFLNAGYVKFRNRNSWNQNWGGVDFPKGSTLYYGDNIIVEEGQYHIELNLTDNTYTFEKRS